MTKIDLLREKRKAAVLGGRIGFTFLAASGVFILVAYFILSNNFQQLLTDYTIKLVEAMVDQGVTMIEYELRVSQEEADALADYFAAANPGEGQVNFPEEMAEADILRMLYVSKESTTSSDGRQSDVSKREDILKAFNGQTAVYGPYFNEEKEYVICYSAPVYQNDEVAGVLSVEKDGYSFCELIQYIRFIDSGEAYIINAEGTDIAVSRQEHIDWVIDQYNARRLLEEERDAETESVMELEQKGLNGDTGTGTYYWEGGLYYVSYAPVSSTGWVLLAGMRQEELDRMAQSVLTTSLANGPILIVSIILFLLLTVLVIFWLLSSMKKSAELNKRLNEIANYDVLTGTMNRNCYQNKLEALADEELQSLACIYIDVNGLHEINNHLGHQAGDRMLIMVACELQKLFSQDSVYRIGGDEFVVMCRNLSRQDIAGRMDAVRQKLKSQNFEISVGIEWRDRDINPNEIVNLAEKAMRQDKQRFYQDNGRERQLRTLNQGLEQLVLDKQDADTFLSILAPEFKGVYFVDLNSDAIRHLYIPQYFEDMLRESDDIFSKALRLYTDRFVLTDYRKEFEKFCDYSFVESQLNVTGTLEYTYRKVDGEWLKLRILKFKTYNARCRETLWIFSNMT